MKLLIVTQVVDSNHPILGFFHRWIEEFAKHCESVQVICLYEGTHTLPQNVHVHSLGKEAGAGRLTYVVRFFSYIWKERKEYDSVLVHMNQVYVILGWPIWQLLGKKVGLWYMHRSVTTSLKIASRLVDGIFTGSKESFRLESDRLHITGHGIDTVRFAPESTPKDIDLLTVGRMSASKNLEALVDLLVRVREKQEVTLSIAGAPLTEADASYQSRLETYISEKGMREHVHFLGAVPQAELPAILTRSRVFVHAAQNGSLDKALLEPLAVGIPLVTTAEGANSLPLGNWHPNNPKDFADTVIEVLQSDTTQKSKGLRRFVEENHSITSLIPKILNEMQSWNTQSK